MGYFDGLTDASFKRDKNGDTVFYPFGIFCGGYILPEDKRDHVRTTVKRYHQFSFPLSIVLSLTLISYISILLLLPVLIGLYLIGLKMLLRGFKKSSERLSYTESMTNSARSHSEGSLWLCEIIGIVFVLMGIYKITTSPTWYFGAFVTSFGGLCAIVFAKMIKIKNQTTHNTGLDGDRD